MENNNTHLQICNLCEAMCGLKIQTRNGKVTSIKGNPDDLFSKGHMCAKALALKDIHEHKDRLRQPMRRTPQGWEPISWEAAFKEIEENLGATKKKYGNDSIALYLGNPRGHHHGSLLTSILLRKSLNSKNCFSVASSDHLPHMLAAYTLFGHMAMLPVPDIDRTDYLLCFGANPVVSNGSIMGAPYIKKRLKALQDRGGTITTIDPRKTETGEMANKHIYIYPGQDAYLLLSMIYFIFKNKWLDQGEWQSYTHGIDELRQLIQAFDIDKMAVQTGIEIGLIESLTLEFTTSKRALAYGRFGVCTQKHGAVNAWLIYVLNIITGNLDQAGGLMFPRPAVDLALLSAIINEDGGFDAFQSKQWHLPSFDSEIPVVEMADEMLGSHPGAIKAFINVSGNPVLSTPDGKKLEKALGQLDFMVSVDGFINETNRFAHIVLPPTSALERSEYNMMCNLTAVRNNARYSGPLFSPPDDAKHDWQIFLQLSGILNREYSLRSISLRLVAYLFKQLEPDGVLDLMLKLGPYGTTFRRKRLPKTFKEDEKINKIPMLSRTNLANKIQYKLQLLFKVSPLSKRIDWNSENSDLERKIFPLTLKQLKSKPNGIDLGAMNPSLPERLFTRDKTINLIPDIYQSELKGINKNFSARIALTENEFYLVGRRTPRSMNSWLNNIERLTKGRPANTLLMNQESAHSLNLKEGDRVRLESNQQFIVVVVELCSSIMKGVISLPHGWGRDMHAGESEVADDSSKASFNDLTSNKDFDSLSGVSVLSGFIVKVS
ncbi:MAG: molybdopterin-dependent oxidoreductase [Pseudomonadales bacterium]|nr:molybdopterin-dependent oxidoreductase [Pseudomonadales bacterium]